MEKTHLQKWRRLTEMKVLGKSILEPRTRKILKEKTPAKINPTEMLPKTNAREKMIAKTNSREKMTPAKINLTEMLSKTNSREKINPTEVLSKTNSREKMLAKSNSREKMLAKSNSREKMLAKSNSREKMPPKTNSREKILAKMNSREKIRMAWRRRSRHSSRGSTDSLKAFIGKRGSSGSVKSMSSCHSSPDCSQLSPIPSMAGTTNEHPNKNEFMIAADLTLYANPLRILNKHNDKNKHDTTGPETDMIAADLVKYGCPLDERL